MTTKQMLLAATLIFGAMSNVGLAMNQEDGVEQQEMNEELLGAAFTGRLNKVKRLVNAGADVNAEDKYKRTALHNAASMLITNMFKVKTENRIAIAEVLIENGADINARSDKGLTALGIAAIAGNSDIARLLESKGGSE